MSGRLGRTDGRESGVANATAAGTPVRGHLAEPNDQGSHGSESLMSSPEHFRISTHLKDIIGRDLVTNQFVAVFELVKNSIDANAARVDIGFDLDMDRMWIVDDGKGMDAETLRDRWLFVAYSAKADGTEDTSRPSDYRNQIRPQGQYAGSKGIGRFSCDTLGKSLVLYSRTSADDATQQLSVEWEDFEANSRDLFQTVDVDLEPIDGFPNDLPVPVPANSGTVLRIDDLRADWYPDEILRLRQYLEKLIDPFGTTQDTPVHITVVDSELDEKYLAQLEGPVGNDISDLLSEKTTRIEVNIEEGRVHTQLVDRGREVYRITERSPYEGLKNSSVHASVYYLNRSAKHTFTRRMGVRPIEFGSIFLFRNGFRILPIGEETDDTFRLNRRKQQGSSRYLGTRDVMGRIDVTAPPGVFRETSSRDAGLIEDANVRDLYDAIHRKVIVRLERYVVGVTWQDKADQFRDDASGLSIGTTRERVVRLLGQLASTKDEDLELEYYDPELVDGLESEASALHRVMTSLTAIAERQNDTQLLHRMEEAKARQIQLEESEREAAEAARRALADKARADERIASLERQATYLAATQDMTAEQMTLLLHQVLIYSGHIGAAVDRALSNARKVAGAASEIDLGTEGEDLEDAAAAIRVRNRQVVDDLDYIHLENDRLMAVARFAANARFELETDQLDGDVVAFLEEYINEVRVNRDGVDSILFESNGVSLPARFRPVDLVVVVDNLVDNARQHGAQNMRLSARRRKGGKLVDVLVTDDGRGMDEQRVDPAHIFDKGYTSTPGGTGLGLYHARKVMEEMEGGLQLDPDREPGRASFVIMLPRTTG